jgi:hypothetical protein
MILSWSSIASGTCHINEKPPELVVSYLKALSGEYTWDMSCGRMAQHTWLTRTMVFSRVSEK